MNDDAHPTRPGEPTGPAPEADERTAPRPESEPGAAGGRATPGSEGEAGAAGEHTAPESEDEAGAAPDGSGTGTPSSAAGGRPSLVPQEDPPPWRWPAVPRPLEEVRRHEAHLVGQILHLMAANKRLEEQLDRLARVTEIADIFRQKKISRDTFELPAPMLTQPAEVQAAWNHLEAFLADLPEDTPQLDRLRESLGIVRTTSWVVDADWLADVRNRLIAAEQAIAFLDEQSRELDLLRDEKSNIVDGVGRLEQTIEDLWKSLNEKTTHIQRIEAQLQRIWSSPPYRLFKTITGLFRRRRPSS